MFVRNDDKTPEPDTELKKDLQITEENIITPSPSIPFIAPLQENDLSNLTSLSNLKLLADVCSDKPQMQMLLKLEQKEQEENGKKERKRSYDEAQTEQKPSTQKHREQTSKKRCLYNPVKAAKNTSRAVERQDKTSSMENGKKRKRQEVLPEELLAGQKRSRTGRAIKIPSKMDL